MGSVSQLNPPEYSTKLSHDKFEPIFGDLGLRRVPCNCFLGFPFFVATYSTLPASCRQVRGWVSYGRVSWAGDRVKYGCVKSCKIVQNRATSDRVLRTTQHLVVFSRFKLLLRRTLFSAPNQYHRILPRSSTTETIKSWTLTGKQSGIT